MNLKSIFNRLLTRAILAMALSTFVFGALVYQLTTEMVEEYVVRSVEREMGLLSRNVLQLFDQSAEELFRQGRASNPIAVRIAQAKSRAKFDDFLRDNYLQGALLGRQQEVLFGSNDFPLQLLSGEQQFKAHTLYPSVAEKQHFFLYAFDYKPWGQQIVLLQDKKLYAELSQGLYELRNGVIALLLIGVISLVVLLHYNIERPISSIISALSKNRAPDYQGVFEFEYLSDSFSRMLKVLQGKQKELERASRAKDEFLASMSHELRTPLASIIGNSELLADSSTIMNQPHLLQVVDAIESAGRNQLALVNDILDLSKIDAGKFTIDERPYDLAELLSGVTEMFAVRLQDAGLQLSVKQNNREQYQLIGDAQRISQILINLIGNAIKFTERGAVSLSTAVVEDRLQFTVSDTGIGMSPAVVDHLFERFQQADSSISRRYGGSGLGLYISYNLAQLMGGTIEVSSEKGRGSTFCLQLPYHRSDQRVIDDRSRSREGSDELQPLFQGAVLIAEDTPELQLLERRILESMGLTVSAVENGVEAVALGVEGSFDLILMDMQMPVMDGIEATRQIRRAGNMVPIVALTANVMQKHREAFSEAGCDDFLGKPIDKKELQRVLKKYISQPAEAQKHQAEEEVDDELMAIFIESTTQRKIAMEQALSDKDWSQLREIAHATKGSAASFGFPELSEAAKNVQLALDESRSQQAFELSAELLREMERVL